MASKNKKRLFNILRISVCIAALWFVVQGVTLDDHVTLQDGSVVAGRVAVVADPVSIVTASGSTQHIPHERIAHDSDGALRITYGVRSALARSSWRFLLLALAIHFLVTFPQSVRLHWMLRAQQIRVSVWESIKLSFAGNFLNFAAPLGSNAGDVFKAYFLSLHTDRKTEAVTTIVLDRMIGLASMIAVVALIIVASPSENRIAQFRPYVLTMVVVGVTCAVLYLSRIWERLVPTGWVQKIPMLHQLRRIDNTARTLARHYVILAGCILVTVVLQAMAMGAYFTIAVAVGLDARFDNILEYYAYFYTGAFIQALPGPPQGLGTVELAYRYLFASFGSPSQIICVAFLIRLMVLACALPGLWVTLTGAYKPAGTNRWEDAMDQKMMTLTGEGAP